MKKILIIVIMTFVLTLTIAFQSDQPNLKITQGENYQIVASEWIYSYDDSEVFSSVIRSSGEKPMSVEFKGIELAEFLKDQNIDFRSSEKITFNASDGYRIAIKTEEILDPRNVYIVYEMNGEKLKSKRENGTGPYRIVIRKDPFSQRWIKHLEEIIVQ